MSKVTAADIEALTESFERSGWDTLQLEVPGFQLHLSKSGSPSPAATPSPAAAGAAVSRSVPAPAAPPQKTAKKTTALNLPAGWIAVRAPNLGTFYRAPKPGAQPFVEIGQQVEPKTELCLLEVMKLFTSVVAGVKGVVREVLVADGEMVEHDQPLIVLEPQ